MLDFLQGFLPPIVGSFSGVTLGFLVEHWLEKRRRNRLRGEYTRGLKSEITQCIDLLKKRLLQLLPDDLWKSLVSSGDLAIFPFDQREDLRQAYFAIGKCNYEFIRARDLGEKFRAEADTPSKQQQIGSAWKATTDSAYHMTDSTRSFLEGLANHPWWRDC